MDNLRHLVLYKELARRASMSNPIAIDLKARLDRAAGQMDRVLRDIRRYFAHFTDHSIEHSIRIAHNIGCLLRREQLTQITENKPAVSSIDIFLLISAALVHDVGMVVGESEVDDLARSEDFMRLAASWRADDSDWFRRGVPRQMLAEYVRRQHAKRSCKFVLDSKLVPAALIDDAPQLARWLGVIAAGHGMSFSDICNERLFPTNVQVALGGSLLEECNPRFIAMCLRLGDLLDINTSRACPILRNLSEPLGAISASHWDQYRNISIRGLKPESNILIEGVCPTQDAERVLREWIGWLEKEAANITQATNTDEDRYRLAIGRVQSTVSAELVNGIPVYEFLEYRFNLDEQEVFERLFGQALYGRPELAIRELIQNAIDAQRALILHELTKDGDWSSLSAQEQQKRFIARRALRQRSMPIRIRLLSNPVDTEQKWLSVEDGGIGMSRDVIGKYLLKVGRSRWGHDPTTTRLGLGSSSIGRFGVGFLSTLMIADRVVVDTRSCLPDEPGVCATVYGWQGFAATTPSGRSRHGTEIRLLLKDGALAGIRSLITEIARQVPLLEFPILIEEDGLEQSLPQILSDPSKTQTCIQVAEDDSRIVLRAHVDEFRRPLTLWTRRMPADHEEPTLINCEELALCQDGIAISAMRRPQTSLAEATTFDELRGIIDLRGSSRVALDLSRNLVEGDPEDFWYERWEWIWQAIAAAMPTDAMARYAVVQLIGRAAQDRDSQPYFIVDGTQFLREVPDDVDALIATEAYQLLRETDRADNALWLMPSAPEDLPGHLSNRNEDDQDYDEMSKTGDEEEDSDRFEAEKIIWVFRNVAQHWSAIVSAFPWIRADHDQKIRMQRNHSSGAIHFTRLMSFQLSKNWRVVFSREERRHVLVPSFGYEDILETAQHARLSYSDLQVFICISQPAYGISYDYTTGEASTYAKACEAMSLRLNDALVEIEDSGENENAEYDDSDNDELGEDQYSVEEERVSADFFWRRRSLLAPVWNAKWRLYRGIAKRHQLREFSPPWERFKMRGRTRHS